jgi:hypothetical protein
MHLQNRISKIKISKDKISREKTDFKKPNKKDEQIGKNVK